MNPEQEFNLAMHLQKKSNGAERVTIPLETYDQAIPVITNALRQAILSPKNHTGFTSLVIFGSWARRDKKTGPTADSDIDLLAYKKNCGLAYIEEIKFEAIVRSLILKEKLERGGMLLPETNVYAGIDQHDMENIKLGRMSLTRAGYIIVSAN